MESNINNNKRIAKNTIYLYARLLVSLVIGLYTSRVILEVLGVEDYGIYNIVGGFVAMLSILTSTIRSAAQRFITYALGLGDGIKLRQTMSTFITLYLVVAVIVFLIGECVGLLFLDKILVLPESRLDAAFSVFHCSLLVFVINLIAIPYNACVIAHERMNFFAVISIAESLMKLIIVFLLLISPFDALKSYAVGLCIVALVTYLVYRVYCEKQFSEAKGKLTINKSIFRELFSYSVWVAIGSSSGIIKEQGVNIVINNFCGVVMNAAKGVSTQVDHVVTMFATNIGTAISPQITKAYACGDINRAIKLTFSMAKIQGVLLLFLCIPLIVETDYVLGLWLKDVPDHAVLFTKWCLALCIIRSLDNSVVPLNLAIGKVKYVQMAGGGLMLLNLPLSYMVLKMGADPVATVIVGIIIEFLVLFVVSLFLNKYVNFPIGDFFIKAVISVIVVAIGTFLVTSYVSALLPNGFLRLVIAVVLSSTIIALTSYFFVLSKLEREMLKGFIKRK